MKAGEKFIPFESASNPWFLIRIMGHILYTHYTIYYHFIPVVKYRKTIFTNNSIVDFLKTKEIVETFNVDILDIECD
jgi:REP element-mobilizing transposase RayT